MAGRRARRAEPAGDALRVHAADLEAQLVRARAELEAAREQREDLAARLKQAERDLRAARQTEHAETARRAELEEDAAGAARVAQDEAATLRAALAAREERVAELEEELTRLLSSGLQDRLHENQQSVARLERALHAERAVREQALSDLAAERDRSRAEVTLLQHELDHRGHVHDAISRQLVDLRSALESTRAQLVVDAGRKAVAEAVLADLGSTAAHLRTQLQELEGERSVLLEQLAAARAAVAHRDGQLVAGEAALTAAEAAQAQLRAELDAAEIALRSTSSDAAETHVRLQAVEQAMAGAETRARELTRRLETERLQWIQAEATLQRTMAEEREAARHTLEQERARFAGELQDLRSAMETLRERLAGAQDHLGGEHRAREVAERRVAGEQQARVTLEDQLLEARADAAVAAERAASEHRARLAAEERAGAEAAARAAAEEALAARERTELEIIEAVAALRAELVRLRADNAAQHEREGRLDGLVDDLVATAEELNAEFERELAALEAAQERQLAAQRTQFEGQLGTLENRVVDLREQMATATAEMVRKLEAERTARRRAEAELARERELARATADADPAGDGEEGDDVDHLRAELVRREREGRLAEERIVELEDELEQARVALRPPTDLPPADHPALAGPAGAVEAVANEADSVIIDLARAAARLRTRRGEEVAPPEAGDDVAPDADPVHPSSGPDLVQVSDLDAEELAEEDAALAEELDDEDGIQQEGGHADDDRPDADGTAGEPDEPHTPGTPPARLVAASARAHRRTEGAPGDLPPSYVKPEIAAVAEPDGPDGGGGEPEGDVENFELGHRLGRQYVSSQPWLTTAISRLARRDPRVAASVIESLLPVQAARLQRDLTYDIAIAGHPELRVDLHADGTASIARRSAEDAADSASFRIVGSPVALAAYVGGAAPRRGVPGVVITGRRRRAKKLTHVMREPVNMAELTLLTGRLPALTLMTLLVASIDPAETRGDHFTLAFAEGEDEPAVHVVVAGGLPIGVRAGAPLHIAATVRVPPRGLTAFLGGQGPARVNGDLGAVGRFLSWADTAQGLDG